MPVFSYAQISDADVAQRALTQNIVSQGQDLVKDITRWEAASLYVNIVKDYRWSDAVNNTLATISKPCTFADIDTSNLQIGAITESCKLWVFKWADGSFFDKNNLTPAEAMVTLMRVVWGKQDETTTPNRRQNYYDIAVRNNVIPSTDLDLITNGQTISSQKILSRIYNVNQSTTLKADPAVQNASVAMFAQMGDMIANTVESGVTIATDAIASGVDQATDIVAQGVSGAIDTATETMQAGVDVASGVVGAGMEKAGVMLDDMQNMKHKWGLKGFFAKRSHTGRRRLPRLLLLAAACLLWRLIKRLIWACCGCDTKDGCIKSGWSCAQGNKSCKCGPDCKCEKCTCDKTTCLDKSCKCGPDCKCGKGETCDCQKNNTIQWSSTTAHVNTNTHNIIDGSKVVSAVSSTHHDHDDLKIIEGIGPKIEQVLFENNITTFAQIADMTPTQLSNILKKYGPSIAQMVTETRPRQAALARDGKIDELDTWKKELDNGKEVL